MTWHIPPADPAISDAGVDTGRVAGGGCVGNSVRSMSGWARLRESSCELFCFHEPGGGLPLQLGVDCQLLPFDERGRDRVVGRRADGTPYCVSWLPIYHCPWFIL